MKSEIDDKKFIEIIFSLWKNKFKIILLPIIFLIASFIFTKNSAYQNKEYIVYSQIKPLAFSDENQYTTLNQVSRIISNYSSNKTLRAFFRMG